MDDSLESAMKYLDGLPPEEREAALALGRKEAGGRVWTPQPGPQTNAYISAADEMFFGGASGGGKSDLVVGLAINEHKQSLILREYREDAEFLLGRAEDITGARGNHSALRLELGDKLIEFRGCRNDEEKQRFKGKPRDFMAPDEVGDLPESVYTFIQAWNRTNIPGQRCRVVATGNPPTRPRGLWVVKRWAAWIDDTHPNPAKCGDLRWYTTVGGKDTEVDGRGPHHIDGEEVYAQSRTFFRSKLADNMYYGADYAAKLASLPEALRRAYRDGQFFTTLEDDLWQTIPTLWIQEAMKRWTPNPPAGVPMCAIAADLAQGGCFDDQTEILTRGGWMPFYALRGDEQVLSLNGEVAEWAPITQLHKYKFDGLMNLYEGQRGINFCITDNHNLIVRSKNRKSWRIIRYDQAPKFLCLKRTNKWIGSSDDSITFVSEVPKYHGGKSVRYWKFDIVDWARFLGWFVSEGCVFQEKRHNGRWRVNISQNYGWKFDRIKTLLEKMGIKAYSQKSRSALEFSINPIGIHLAEHCGIHAKNKKIPEYIKDGTPEVIEAFLEEYRLGDGYINGGGTKIYSTTSRKLADDLQEVLLKLGRCGRLSVKNEAGTDFFIGDRRVVRKNSSYCVNEVSGGDAYLSKDSVEKVEYHGYVYCVSTPHKTIAVRRNGSVMWSGNSDQTAISARYDWWYAPVITIPGSLTPDGPSVASQVVKHRRDSCPIILDMGGGYGGSAYDHLISNLPMQQQGSKILYGFKGAEGSSALTRDRQLGFLNKRAESWWKFREALDPGQPGGSPIALPDDMELLAELAAPLFTIGKGGIQIEEKKLVRKRLGRSTDRADAIIMCDLYGQKGLTPKMNWQSTLRRGLSLPTTYITGLQSRGRR